MEAEGWYRDPFGAHADRWFSAGRPTALVRDGEVEAQDPPPESTYTGVLVDIKPAEPPNPDDLKRADDVESGVFDEGAKEAEFDAIMIRSLPPG
jgi:hypothetical protein